jgi:hypothetical protein
VRTSSVGRSARRTIASRESLDSVYINAMMKLMIDAMPSVSTAGADNGGDDGRNAECKIEVGHLLGMPGELQGG